MWLYLATISYRKRFTVTNHFSFSFGHIYSSCIQLWVMIFPLSTCRCARVIMFQCCSLFAVNLLTMKPWGEVILTVEKTARTIMSPSMLTVLKPGNIRHWWFSWMTSDHRFVRTQPLDPMEPLQETKIRNHKKQNNYLHYWWGGWW